MRESRRLEAPRWVVLEGAEPGLELDRVGQLLALGEPAVVTATLEGDGVALGRFQRRSSDDPLRRWCGGRTTRYGAGVFSLSVITRGIQSDLRGEQILRRQAQRVVRALSALGVNVAYPGRDFLTVGGLRVGYVSLERTSEGALLFQTLLSLDGGDLLTQPALEFPGLPPYPPSGNLGPNLGPRLAEALIAQLGPAAQIPDPPTALDRRPPEPELDGLVSAGPVAIPIGALEAWVAVDPHPRLSTVRLLGDWIASSADVESFQRALEGRVPTHESLAPVVERWLSLPGAILVGVTNPEQIVRAILESARLVGG